MLEKFTAAVDAQKDPEVKGLLKDLRDLYAVHTLRNNAVWYLENDHLDTEATHALKRLEHDLNAKIRPRAQALVDGFGIPAQLLTGTPAPAANANARPQAPKA